MKAHRLSFYSTGSVYNSRVSVTNGRDSVSNERVSVSNGHVIVLRTWGGTRQSMQATQLPFYSPGRVPYGRMSEM